MKKIVHHIRSKPDHIKTRYVIFLSLVATLMVVGVWILVLASVKSNDDTIKTESPFSILKGIFSESFSEVDSKLNENKASLDQTLDTIESMQTSGTGDAIVPLYENGIMNPISATESGIAPSGMVPTSATASQDTKTTL